MYNNLLVFFIRYQARCKEYHHQKLALESRNFCHTSAYLATLLHSTNAKDVELMAYTRKKCCKGFCCVNFIIVLKENVLIFNATFSRSWCMSSSILRTFRPLSHERHESYDFNFCHVILSATAFHTSDSNRTTLFHNGSGRSGCCVSAGRFTKECYVIR